MAPPHARRDECDVYGNCFDDNGWWDSSVSTTTPSLCLKDLDKYTDRLLGALCGRGRPLRGCCPFPVWRLLACSPPHSKRTSTTALPPLACTASPRALWRIRRPAAAHICPPPARVRRTAASGVRHVSLSTRPAGIQRIRPSADIPAAPGCIQDDAQPAYRKRGHASHGRRKQ